MAKEEFVTRKLSSHDPRWLRFVAEHPDAGPFHDPRWSDVLARTYGYPHFTLALINGAGKILAGAPVLEVRSLAARKRWISLPFTDECPLLVNRWEGARSPGDVFTLGLRNLGAPALEVRGTMEGVGWQTSADAVIHELELDSDLETVSKQFSRSQVLRNIKRAQREGVVVRRAETPQDLDAFYALHTRTRRRQGVPVQPRRFFDLLWSKLVASGFAFILLADAGGRDSVAGALFLAGGGTTIYKFGASDPEAWSLRPNHLIFWTAIQEACARGHRCFDFGRTDLDNSGLRAFKSSWGAAERPLKYSTVVPGRGAEAEGLASRALSVAIRRGPQWVCRGTGEALYRYAASR